jgi:hypothetical protein
MQLNLDYYHWGPTFRNEAGEWVDGHFTGSGLPIKFVDEQGRILNIYQQLTQLADDHLLDVRYGGQEWGGQPRLKAQDAIRVSQSLLRRSLADHCAVAANFHPDLYFVHPVAADEESRAQAAQWLEGTLDYAVAQGIPIWSAEEWLRFTAIRHDTDIKEVAWQPTSGRLSFRLTTRAVPGVELSVMVPSRHGDAQLIQTEVDGLAVKHRTRKLGGVNYGWLSVSAGARQVVAIYG